jgi:hypothetical protein
MRDDFSDAAPGGACGRDEAPLTDLQQAYLLGREQHLPLGGVAMQEFREYRGAIDVAALPQRLLAMVERHPALRTHVDSQRRVSWVSPDPAVNYDEIDLRGLPQAEALAWIDGQREDYAHRLFDLARSPWNVTAFRLPEPEADDSDRATCALFARFDALILDGRAIASLLVELLDGEAPAFEAAALPQPADEAKRGEDAAYWARKLQPVEGPPQLPWTKPLEAIAASRYERESLTIPRERFTTLCRLAARERLFKNTAVTAVILETLSHWLSDGAMCVGIPVAPRRLGRTREPVELHRRQLGCPAGQLPRACAIPAGRCAGGAGASLAIRRPDQPAADERPSGRAGAACRRHQRSRLAEAG